MSSYYLTANPLALAYTSTDGKKIYHRDKTSPVGTPAKPLEFKNLVKNLESSMQCFAAQYSPGLPEGSPFIITAHCLMGARKPNGWATAKRSKCCNVPPDALVIL
jgi:hypothetical protein